MRTSILESGEVVTFEDPNEGRQIRVESHDEGQVTHAEPAEIAAPATPWRARLEINGYPHNSNNPHGQLGDKVWVMQDAYTDPAWDGYEPQMLISADGKVHRRLVFVGYNDSLALSYWAFAEKDGDAIAAVTYYPPSFSRTALVRFDADGNIIWQKSFRSSAANQYLQLWRAITDSDGNIYLGGPIDNFTKSVIAKFSPTGTLLWGVQFDVPNAHFYIPLNTLSDGGIVVASPGRIAKLSSTGTTVWCKKANLTSYFQSPYIRNGNNDITYAVYSVNTPPNKAVLVAVDSDGNFLWQRAWANLYGTAHYSPTYGLFAILSSYTAPLDTAYIVNLTDAGVVKWVRRLVGPPFSGRWGHSWVVDETGSLYIGLDVNSVGGYYKACLMHLPANGSGQGTYTDTEWGDWVYENCDEPALEVPDPWVFSSDPGHPPLTVPYDIIEVAEPLTIRMLGQHFGEDA